MFTDFLYVLRGYGMKTSLNEWTGLMDALDLNLNEASLTEFYHMARAILVKKNRTMTGSTRRFWSILKMLRNRTVCLRRCNAGCRRR